MDEVIRIILEMSTKGMKEAERQVNDFLKATTKGFDQLGQKGAAKPLGIAMSDMAKEANIAQKSITDLSKSVNELSKQYLSGFSRSQKFAGSMLMGGKNFRDFAGASRLSATEFGKWISTIDPKVIDNFGMGLKKAQGNFRSWARTADPASRDKWKKSMAEFTGAPMKNWYARYHPEVIAKYNKQLAEGSKLYSKRTGLVMGSAEAQKHLSELVQAAATGNVKAFNAVKKYNMSLKDLGITAKRFKPEWLSVMFFGMAMTSVFGAAGEAAMDMAGILEYADLQMNLMAFTALDTRFGIDAMYGSIDDLVGVMQGAELFGVSLADVFGGLSIASRILGPIISMLGMLMLGIQGVGMVGGPTATALKGALFGAIGTMVGAIPGLGALGVMINAVGVEQAGQAALETADTAVDLFGGAAGGAAAGAAAGAAWKSAFALVVKGGIAGIIAGMFSDLIGNSTISSILVGLAAGFGTIFVGGFIGGLIALPALLAESFTKAFLPEDLGGQELVGVFATAISAVAAAVAVALGVGILAATAIAFAALAAYIGTVSLFEVTGWGKMLNQWGKDMYAWSKKNNNWFVNWLLFPNKLLFEAIYENVPGNKEYVDTVRGEIGEYDLEDMLGQPGNAAAYWDKLKGAFGVGAKSGFSSIPDEAKAAGYTTEGRIREFLKDGQDVIKNSADQNKEAAKIAYENPMKSTMEAAKVVIVDLSKSTSKEIADSVTAGKPYLETALQVGLVDPYIKAVDNILATMSRIPAMSSGGGSMPSAVATAGATYEAVSSTYGSASKAANDAANSLIQAITSNTSSGGGSMPSAVATAGATYKAVSSTYGSASKAVSDAANLFIAAITNNVSRFATGGIVTQPTFAYVGEKGPEAIVPLDKYGNTTEYNDVNVEVHISADISGSYDVSKLADEIDRELYARFKRRYPG